MRRRKPRPPAHSGLAAALCFILVLLSAPCEIAITAAKPTYKLTDDENQSPFRIAGPKQHKKYLLSETNNPARLLNTLFVVVCTYEWCALMSGGAKK